MEKVNTNDWFATRLLNTDKSLEFILSEGINSQNSELKDKDFYKNKNKVQEIFKKDDGNFDEDAFNNFYDNISKEYSYLSAIDTENFILNAYEKSESNFSTNFGNVIDQQIQISRTPNPLDQNYNISSLNEWSTPVLSKREAAQKNRYWDNDLQKWSEETVNDAGLLGILSGKPLVYAIWDEDGEHIDKMTGQKVKHYAGEWKTDEFGNYYTETINNEDSAGKQFVTWSEVITDDSSPWNKIDIFDSDSIEQNIPRTLLKAVAIGAATLLAPQAVSSTLFYSTAAINLARVLPQVSKSILSFFGTDDFDNLNKWDNTMRRFGRSTSDYSQEHFFGFENILNMAIDSYMQLGQQRAIATIPQLFSTTQKAQKQIDMAARLSSIKLISQGKMSQNMLEALTKGSSLYRDAEKLLNKASKVSSAISRAYLVTTAVDDVYNQAKLYGFDNQTAGLISLATYAGIGALFQTDYFRGLLYNTPEYELSRNIRTLTKKYLKNNSEAIAKDLSAAATTEAKKNVLKRWGNNISNFFKNNIVDNDYGRFSIVYGAVGEGVEETMEEIAQDISFQVGKSWQSLKELFLDQEYNNNYDYSSTNPLLRYGSSFFGGAIGGAIFKTADRLKFDKAAYNNWKELLGGDNKQIMNEFVKYVSQGKKDLILNEINKLKRSPILSTNISAFTGEATDNINESQNSILFGSLEKAINDIDTFLSQDNLKIDEEKFGNIEVIKGLRAAWLIDSNLSNSLYEDYQNLITEIVNIKGDIQNTTANLSDKATEQEKNDANNEISKLKKVLNTKLEQVSKLLNGEDDSYIGRLMLESNKDKILNFIVPTTKESLSKHFYGVDYNELPNRYQKIIDDKLKNLSNSGQMEINYISAWNSYKELSSSDIIKSLFKEFDNVFQQYTTPNVIDDKTKNLIQLASAFILKNETENNNGINIPTYNISQIQNLINTALGTKSLVFDNEDDGAIGFLSFTHSDKNERDLLINQWLNDLEESKKSAYQKIQQNPNLLQELQVAINNGDTFDKLDDNEIIALNFDLNDKNELIKLLDKIYSINDETLLPMEQVSSSLINNFLNKVSRDLLKEGYNIADFIKEQLTNSEIQRTNYFLNTDTLNQLIKSKDIIKLLKAIINGSDISYRNDILDVPFGANNFLNEAFRDKNIKLELSQLNPNSVYALDKFLLNLENTIDNLIETDRKNKGLVVTTEKQLGIKYLELKINGIKQIFFNDSIDPILAQFKDTIKSWNVDIVPINDIKDSEYVQISANYRNALLEFERAFYSYFRSLNEPDKINFISAISNKIKDIDIDTLSLDTNILSQESEPILSDSTLYWYFVGCSLGNSDLILNTYKNLIDASDKFPFDSQEDIIVYASKFLLTDNDSFKDIKLWIDVTKGRSSDIDDSLRLHNILKVICSGGTGKTSTIINFIYNIISKVNPQKNCIFAANTPAQIESLKKSVNLSNDSFTTITSLIEDLKSNNLESISKYKDSVIVIDECTNISIKDLQFLNDIADKNNIRFVMLGDTKQYGTDKGIDFIVCPMTVQLSESKRAATNISRNNNYNFEKLFKSDLSGVPDLNVKSLKEFEYFETDEIFDGIKFDIQGDKVLTLEYIEEFYQKYIKDSNKTLLVVTKDLDKLGDVSKLSTKYNITFASTIKDIQGAEWDYTITDWDLDIDGDLKKDYTEAYSKLREIYTLFTRHKSGLISFKGLVWKNLKYGAPGTFEVKAVDSQIINNKLSQYPPIESGISNNLEALEEFKRYKKEVFDKLILNEETPKQEEQLLPEVKTETINKDSLAQVAVGFMLKSDFDENFIKSLNLKDIDYSTLRNILYSILTNPKNESLKDTLPESLKNGKFLIKFFDVTTEDLMPFGNLLRDNKYLNGRHPWIVYKVGDIDIHLGMFHNAETSAVVDSKISVISKTINELESVEKGKSPTYYNIPSNITISRSQNIVDVQDRETRTGEYLDVFNHDGRLFIRTKDKQDKIELFESTPSFYFRRLANESIVPVVKITDTLEDISALYKEVFDLIKPNNKDSLFKEHIEEIKELLSLDRSNNKWKARDVVRLNNRFVSFITLKLPNNKSLTGVKGLSQASLEYLSNLYAKRQQLTNVLNILKNSDIDDEIKINKVLEQLQLKVMFNVVPLVYDSDKITDKKEFNSTIDLITTSTRAGSSRKRNSYNEAVTHQLGVLLQKIAALKLYSNSLWLGEDEKFFNKKDAAYLTNIWDKYKNSLIDAYIKWSEIEDVNNINEDTLIKFLTSNYTRINDENNSRTSVDVFTNSKGENLLQTQSFREFLWTIYSDKKWYNPDDVTNSISYKINGLGNRRAKNKNEQIALDYFKDYSHGQLIKDNGIDVLSNGDGIVLANNNSFSISNKVIQQGRIFVYADNNIEAKDFTRYNTDNNISKAIELPVTEDIKQENTEDSNLPIKYNPRFFTDKKTGKRKEIFRPIQSYKESLSKLLTSAADINVNLANEIYLEIISILETKTIPNNSILFSKDNVSIDKIKTQILQILRMTKVLNC